MRVKSVKILMKMPKKEVEIMKELKMLEFWIKLRFVLNVILYIAKDLIQLEIENLKELHKRTVATLYIIFMIGLVSIVKM